MAMSLWKCAMQINSYHLESTHNGGVHCGHWPTTADKITNKSLAKAFYTKEREKNKERENHKEMASPPFLPDSLSSVSYYLNALLMYTF